MDKLHLHLSPAATAHCAILSLVKLSCLQQHMHTAEATSVLLVQVEAHSCDSNAIRMPHVHILQLHLLW